MKKNSGSFLATHQTSSQAGNTLLGFVLGLALGLIVALVVAWAITKNPPQEKTNTRAPDLPLVPKQDGTNGESRDVNAPLKSKSKDPESEDKKAEDKKADAPADSKSEAASVYWLQIGAYSTKADAEAQKAKMALQGIQTTISEHSADNKKVWRVRVGPFNSNQDSQPSKRLLEDAGIPFSVIKASKS